MKQNLPFHGRIFSDNFQLDQIQNGRLSALINFDIADVVKPLLNKTT